MEWKQVLRCKISFADFSLLLSHVVLFYYWWNRRWLTHFRVAQIEVKNFVMCCVNRSKWELWTSKTVPPIGLRVAHCVVVWCFIWNVWDYLLTMRLHCRKLSYFWWIDEANGNSRTCWPMAKWSYNYYIYFLSERIARPNEKISWPTELYRSVVHCVHISIYYGRIVPTT